MLVFSDVQSLCISDRLWLQVGSPKRLRSDLNQTAQTYQSINRAIQAMRKYDGDTTAYNFEGFGINDPIIAWINENYPEESMIANN